MVKNPLQNTKSVSLKPRSPDDYWSFFPHDRVPEVVREYVIARKIISPSMYNTYIDLGTHFLQALGKYETFFSFVY